MFKHLKYYYVVVTLPFAMLLIGSTIFSGAIKGTLTRNPHPQINYTIFFIVLFGGILITISAHKLVKEARNLVEYAAALRDKTDWRSLQIITSNYIGEVAGVLQMLATSGGRSISHQEQAAIEHELTSARARLMRRNALPQYLSGLLVGMGLLGTFIGLLSTLSDISTLISSFADLDMATANPLLVFRTMIERMKAPMQSMGIAFSASMFGLLGSITLGLMMLGIRRLQGDISSLLGSEVAKHIEVALSCESTAPRSAAGAAAGTGATGEEYKVLLRIEERLAEAARVQQRAVSAEMEDFQRQREGMLRTLAEQNDAYDKFRLELQQLGRQFEAVLGILKGGNAAISSQISDLTVNMAADAKESAKLLGMQVDEQKRLREALDSYKIEERLAEAARGQQRIMTAQIEDFQKQRADMLRLLTDQNQASQELRGELKDLCRQLGDVFNGMERSNSAISHQITELLVHLAADAKESHKLLTMQVSEQARLREALNLASPVRVSESVYS